MLNMMKAEFYRMKRTKVVFILFLIMCGCALAGTISSYMMENATLSEKFIQQAAGFADMMTIVVVGPFFAGLFICNDFQAKTIHSAIMYGKGRRSVVLSKFILYTEMIMIFLLPYAVCTVVGFVSGTKFSTLYSNSVDSVFFTILANEGNHPVNAMNVIKLLVIMITFLLVYASRMSLNLLLVYTIKKPVFVVGIGVAIQLFLPMIGLLANTSKAAESALGWTPYMTYGRVLTLAASWPTILKTLGVCIFFLAFIWNITSSIFEKSDIK